MPMMPFVRILESSIASIKRSNSDSTFPTFYYNWSSNLLQIGELEMFMVILINPPTVWAYINERTFFQRNLITVDNGE